MASPRSPQDSEAAAARDECLSAILASSDFSVADYLNTALEQEDDDDHELLQQSMAELALQLQLRTQSCHEDIGRIGAELQAILPRCAADVSRLTVNLQGLQMDGMHLLQSCSHNDDDNSNHDDSGHDTATKTNKHHHHHSSLETLSTLHALQANLTRTQEILTAAATWDATLETVKIHLSPDSNNSNASNLSQAVTALAHLEKGERALRGMPHPEERIQAMEKIRNQVKHLLQPQLSHALSILSTRIGPLQQCVVLYQQLNQMDALIAEYVKHRPTALHKLWFDYTPSIQNLEETSGESQSHQQQLSSSFANWLPSWLDAVLNLVSEERRQSTSIFGPELVAQIVLQVFKECFRPILPSFKSRLHSIYSPDPSIDENTSTSRRSGSLPAISAIYKSMLQFLSVSYETIVGGWLDMTPNVINTKGAPKLYQELTEVFVFIASPFAEYQTNLSKLEAKYLGEQTQELSKQIQKATMSVTGAGTSLEVLQSTTEQLEELSTKVFPLAESAVARMELLNGGYFSTAAAAATITTTTSTTSALSSIDHFLAGHANELAIAVHKLSAAMTSNDKLLADNFDEPHVLCALGVLKVAGSFARYMRSLEQKSRERLLVLSERVAAYSVREKEVQNAVEKFERGATKTLSFQLSDSMSVVEIDSLLTRSVCIGPTMEALEVSLATLQRLTAVDPNDDGTPLLLYPGTEESAKRVSSSCHTFVYDVCSSVPRLHLSGMSSMAAWKESAGGDSFASYGTLPQEYITHVGEHMLSLVQALEPFATDKEALSLANEVMDGVRRVAQQPWLDFLSASGSVGSESALHDLMDGKKLIDLVVGGVVLDDDEEEDEEEDEETKAVTAFCNAWLDVVGLAVTARLLERIMRIPFLTKKGCEHLHADLGYLVNVFSALGVSGHPHPLLGHLSELATAENAILAERIDSLDRKDEIASFLRAVEERLASMKTGA